MIAMRKKLLLRWVGWFFFINSVLSIIIQASYLTIIPDLHTVYGATSSSIFLAYFFLAVSYVAHAAIINAIVALPIVLITWIIPRKRIVFPLAKLFALLLLIIQIIDRLAYRLYHSHQFAVGLTILKSGVVGEEMPMSITEYVFLFVVIALIFLLEGFIVWSLWRWIKNSFYMNHAKHGVQIFSVLLSCVFVSYSMMAFVILVPQQYRFNDVTSHLLLKMARLVPYYQNVYTWLIPGVQDDVHLWTSDQGHVLVPTEDVNKPLNYPLHPVQCVAPDKKPNILIIVFDTLRYDAVTPVVMPNVFQFAQKTIQFDNMYSGGNCTQPGIFSLFYGIPANYWESTVDQKKGPVLIQQLQKANYQLGIFTSASLLFPQFLKNVFVNLKSVPPIMVGDTSVARDEQVTKTFNQFINQRNTTQPFFSFLFYDAVHNYCEGSSHEHMNPFHPAIGSCARFSLSNNTDRLPYINRYHNAAHFLDQQAAQVIAVLKQKGLLKNTIVIMTADHGEEQNDQHNGYWSHASAYTPYQLHVPMFVYWPGMPAAHRPYWVTNLDVVPTLMQHVLRCQNSVQDYSVGESLFSNAVRPFLISSSYTDYAYVTPHQVTRIYPGGDYSLEDPLGHIEYRQPLDIPLLQHAGEQLSRYYQQ